MSQLTNIKNFKSYLHRSIDLTCMNDETLSYKARFLFYLISTQSENYSIRTDIMRKRSGMGKNVYYEAIKELIKSGYVHRAFRKTEGRINEWFLFTFEKPMSLNDVKKALGDDVKYLSFR
jgi:hypothetical protein